MKKIILKSKLTDEQVLEKLKVISDDLLKKNMLVKGDELVLGIDEQDNGETLVSLNADLLKKPSYAVLKKALVEVGEIISNDIKNFDTELENNKIDDNFFEEEKPEVKEAEGQEKSEKEEAILQTKVSPAIETQLHDTADLLFDINKQTSKTMGNLKELLFSEEEIKEVETPEVKEQAEKKPEEVQHTDSKPEEELKEKEPKAEEKPEEKEHDDDSKEDKKPEEEPEKKDEKPAEEKPEEKEHDAAEPCPMEKEEALKALKEYRKKAANGEELSVAEKFFCESMTKHFTKEELHDEEEPKEDPKKDEEKPEEKTFDSLLFDEEELKKEEEPKVEEKPEEKEHDEDPKEDPKKDEEKPAEEKEHDDEKPEDEKPEEKDRDEDSKEEKVEETKSELIARLNNERKANSLEGIAKENKNKIN